MTGFGLADRMPWMLASSDMPPDQASSGGMGIQIVGLDAAIDPVTFQEACPRTVR